MKYVFLLLALLAGWRLYLLWKKNRVGVTVGRRGGATAPPVAPTVVVRPAGYVPWWRIDKHFENLSDKQESMIVVALGFLFVDFGLYANFPDFPLFKGWGWLHIPIYLFLIVLMNWAMSLKVNQKYAVGLMVVGFTLYGISHMSPGTLEDYRPSFLGGKKTVVLNNGLCTEKVQRATLKDDGEDLNPNGSCYVRVHEETSNHCVDVHDRWGGYLGNDCKGSISLDGKYPTKFAPAADGIAKVVPVTYVLCNKRGNSKIVADGCP